jgi:uncharacterized membrane protein
MHIRTARMESFSDGVIAIVITIMVFDIKFRDLARDFTERDVIKGLVVLAPRLIAYFFSFLVLGLMWLNHHHLFHMVQIVDEKLMWLNLNLLFWLSLIPLPTSMIGKNPFLAESAAIYGGVLCMVSLSFALMRSYIHRHRLMHQDNRKLNREVDKVNKRVRIKNYISILSYLGSVPMAFVSVYISFVLFLLPCILFFIPDGVAAASDNLPPERIEQEKPNQDSGGV